jgi:enediyne biosynthesis protein E4
VPWHRLSVLEGPNTANGPNLLYSNDGSGVFKDVTWFAAVADDGPSQSASFGDYDGDGYVDLFVADHVGCQNGKRVAFPDHLYHNEGDGTFTDQTALLEQ